MCELKLLEEDIIAVVGTRNDVGKPVDINEAEDHIFGLVLMNDWSARETFRHGNMFLWALSWEEFWYDNIPVDCNTRSLRAFPM